jgi:hypothetical protein
MAARETGKQRASRIPLDYYKKRNFMERWKLWLTGAALLLFLAWLAVGLLRSDQGRFRYSRGPVAAVHAMWDDNCDACHVPFTPLSADHWSAALVGQVQTTNERCESCHAGPPHHTNESPSLTCAACHREHRGREASLVRLPDNDCTQCHADLAHHMTSGQTAFKNVTHFTKDHPDFKKEHDPGRLKFNHQLHLSAGMATEAGDPKWTLDRIPAADRDRYRQRGQKDDAPVQLTCAACHRLEGGDFGLPPQQAGEARTSFLPRAVGAYMQPISYDNQCKACHPLTLKPTADGAGKTVTIPHGLQPSAVQAFLWGAYAKQYAGQALARPDQPRGTRPLPGKPAIPAGEEDKAKEAIKRQTTTAEQFLYRDKVATGEKLLFVGKTTCGECHHYKRPEGGTVPERIEPTQVPDVWFTHARFDHAAHRAVDCEQCHDGARKSRVSTDVLLPSIDNCRQCHGPRMTSSGTVHGGARFGCTECHDYHHRSQANALLQGRGAAARGVKDEEGRLKIQQFLSGAER